MRHHAGVFLAVAIGAIAFSSTLSSQVPSLDDVLKRAREAVLRYEQQAALLLADEQCDQKAFETTGEKSNAPYSYTGETVRVDPRGRRKWRAELAMIRTSELTAKGYPWTEFRDIVSVDGRQLPDRADRLSKLFLQEKEWTLQRARTIADESARFNIGTVARHVNTPAVPLLVLHPVNAKRFSFEQTGREKVDATATWKINFQEKLAPTLITAGDTDYCPAAGSFWIDAETGEVVRALLRCSPMRSPEAVNEITVTYRRDAKLGMRLPAEMVEHPENMSGKTSWGGAGKVWVEGKCTYSNFRRFETTAKMILVK